MQWEWQALLDALGCPLGSPGSCGALGEGSCPARLLSGSDSLKHERVLRGCQGNEIIEVIVLANSPVGIQRVRLPVTGRTEPCGL